MFHLDGSVPDGREESQSGGGRVSIDVHCSVSSRSRIWEGAGRELPIS
jgi:hypothetical protein